jgi:hypothetical protein
MIAPHYDEQSARALLYALLVEAGEVAGHVSDISERTMADGGIGYAPVMRVHGRIEWSSRPIWAGAEAGEAELAKRFAIDVARSHTIDVLCESVYRLQHWHETLARYRRSPMNPDLNPVTGEHDNA